MQSKKLSIILMIVIVTVAGWFVSVKTFLGIDNEKAQAQLVQEADGYAIKELYVRAIPKYKEALAYDVGNNAEIEAKLLAAYDMYGDIISYIKLVEKRIADNTAAEQEYIKVADHYISTNKLADAMEVVKLGMEQIGSDALRDYYEENRYGCRTRVVSYTDITPTYKNAIMPAFDGEKWVYVDENGRDLKIGSFDTAVPFNDDGYAVVSVDGKYRTILSNGDLYGIDETGVEDVLAVSGNRVLARYKGKYSYYNFDFQPLSQGSHQYDQITSNSNGVAAVKSGNMWGIITDGGGTVIDLSLAGVAVNSLGNAFSGGHAMVKDNSGWYLIDTEGNRLNDQTYAAAKAPESASGYIAVGNSNGKWGFADLEGNLVIDYKYDDAYSFSDGVAAVCVGETWTYISALGRTVIDYSLDGAQPFHSGRAQAHFVDGTVLISLEYVEK